MRIRPLAFAILYLLCGAASGFAIQRAQPASSAQTSDAAKEDIGDIRPADQTSFLSRFRFAAQAQGEWESNAALQGTSGSGDFLSMPTLEIGYNQPLKHGFSFDLDAKLETVIFSQFNDRGFWGASGAATLDWRYRPSIPRVFISVEP
jgi:hypothetical protein